MPVAIAKPTATKASIRPTSYSIQALAQTVALALHGPRIRRAFIAIFLRRLDVG